MKVVYIDWKDRTDGKTAKIPINYDLSMTDNVKTIADWIKTYNQKYDIRYVVMYHAANKNAPILEKGLLAGTSKRKNFGLSQSSYVYLAINPKMAELFGNMTHNGNYVIYEVIVPIGKILPDRGRLQHTLPDGVNGNSLAHSLVYAGSAKFKGSIERWQIKLYEDESHSKHKIPSFLGNLEQKKQEVKERSAPSVTSKKDLERS